MASIIILDAVGIFWTTLTVAWSLAVVAGAAFLLLNHRRCTPLRIRGIPLSVGAVGLLHGYWTSVQLGYVVREAMPGEAEYWIMGTWLPLGIGLFHASNSRFLHVAKAQRRFVKDDSDSDDDKTYSECEKREARQSTRGPRGLVSRFRRMDHTGKVFTLVGAGMAFQIFVTILVYVMSRKWHSSWGIPGTEVKGDTYDEIALNMVKGWEWAHSVFWQFFWAWIVAPIILWQSRNIHDTQGWRVQTIGCCLASLPATPMWLIALYVPGMEPVNRYFIPPQWIATSIMVLEIFTIFLPCWQVLRHQTLQQETLDFISQWEARKALPADGRPRSVVTSTTAVDSAVLTVSAWRLSANESILTMGALEHVLERNPGPLLEFSALRDFSGENIAFLTSVAAWRSAFTHPSTSHGERRKTFEIEALEMDAVRKTVEQDDFSQEIVREQFNRALKIYVDYISYRRAVFQVNLPSRILKDLEAVFEGPAQDLLGEGSETDPVSPFSSSSVASDGWWRSGEDSSSPSLVSSPSDGCSEKILSETQSRPISTPAQSLSSTLGDRARIRYPGAIPASFSASVFDEAEASVKYLVLTNTWPKFVKERRSSVESEEFV